MQQRNQGFEELANMWPLVVMVLVFPALAATANFPENASPPTTLSVLLVAPPYPGHVIPYLALAEELAQRRHHNVTLLTGDSDFVRRETERLNVTLWSVGEEAYLSPNELVEGAAAVAGTRMVKPDILKRWIVIFQTCAIRLMDHQSVRSFDVIAGDGWFTSFLACFSRKWNIPSVHMWPTLLFSPFDLYPWAFPNMLSGYTDDLSFFQRLVSIVTQNVAFFMLRKFVSTQFTNFEGLCSSANMTVDQLKDQVHFMPQIVASSFGFEFPRAHLPLTDYVGPLLSQSLPPLPPDIAEWLDKWGPGTVVYVSMGSTATLTAEEAEAIVNGATQANLSVVWSLRRSNQHILESMTYDSDRVFVAPWVPQMAVLKHPAIHSAVMHGGLGGIQEALSCQVPIIVIPFFADQLDNAVRVHHYNYGRLIHRDQLTPDLISHTLQLLDSEIYCSSLQKIKRIYRKGGGVSRAADLLEFYSEVGYEHLIPAYVKYNWSWVKYYNVDIYTLMALIVSVPSYLVYKLACRCFHHCIFFRSKRKTD